MSEPPNSSRRVALHDEASMPVDGAALESFARRCLDALGAPAEAELSLALVTPDAIAGLKERFLGERAETDVLAFPTGDLHEPGAGPVLLGDVVICPHFARDQAAALGIPFDDEMRTLVAHGILHLLGRDHADPASERAMAAEQRVLVERALAEAPR